MANLWRALALAWLGGVASPLLLDELPIVDTVQSAEVDVANPSPVSTIDPSEAVGNGETNHPGELAADK